MHRKASGSEWRRADTFPESSVSGRRHLALLSIGGSNKDHHVSMKLFVFAFTCGLGLVGCKSPRVAHSESPVPIQLNQEASYKNGAPQTVRTELMRFTLDGFAGLARVYEFGGANAGVEVIVFKRQPGPSLFPPRTDPRRFAVWALRKNGSRIQAKFRPSPGPMNAGEVYDTDVAELGPAIRLRDIDQITLQIDDTRRNFKIVP